MQTLELLVAGGGIGGLAAALAAARAHWRVRLFERADAFCEVGAAVQLGPNATRILHGWGLAQALQDVAAFPDGLHVRSATTGQTLGELALGARCVRRYGAPYATIHRADLHGLLLAAVRAQGQVQLNLAQSVQSASDSGRAVTVTTAGGLSVEGDALLGADGVRSRVRELLLADGAPAYSGHLAWRAMLHTRELPAALADNRVSVWLGPRLHVVHYPVRGGQWTNLVVAVEGELSAGEAAGWDHAADGMDLLRRMGAVHGLLRDLVLAAAPASVNERPWRLWPLAARAPVAGAGQMARSLVALLGDAAHPMLPYLAQGAGMAIEDAAALGQSLAMDAVDVPTRLQRYALLRWQRVARVQARALRNAQIFHAGGALRWGRDAAMRLLGERVLDVPWLYGGGR